MLDKKAWINMRSEDTRYMQHGNVLFFNIACTSAFCNWLWYLLTLFICCEVKEFSLPYLNTDRNGNLIAFLYLYFITSFIIFLFVPLRDNFLLSFRNLDYFRLNGKNIYLKGIWKSRHAQFKKIVLHFNKHILNDWSEHFADCKICRL